ncbi:MAG: dTDP-4-dehydrorhamnose 3,5-epimerase [Prolixibacteraceae bacterium]|jgi:dTDP-4-dehydrorhamnose 3,5-epimerase|nr:dTDP-4-dehydrorhamnose 3,5-epimerase [Prolixibacteraceae bacterium]MBT6766819.1 dTDP-4-dehydrorhamnose 3,5-epimerase [Prolixibacteraceae bacterium]MBT6997609.1 dTDP-4-dehydrorhamnose 3,5-epimerase [Prolixibacteraceae bacterium]MBT7394916.1 dTDP-4-dehydrorhamnose 3,5-epimerase [Prolixibacteraceae bacterium]
MKIIKTPLSGVVIIEPVIFEDSRGYFFESYQREKYIDSGIDVQFVQDNESKSVKGVIRGLHYQLEPYSQAKLVRVISGRVFDVAVDLRKGSPTFGQWFGLELDSENKKQLFIPRGFAHGFSVLSETAIFTYKCDNVYTSASERAINLNDPNLGINWKLDESERIVSEKDKQSPVFSEAEMNFVF